MLNSDILLPENRTNGVSLTSRFDIPIKKNNL